jgi:oxygen-independent coproporphyrinogen-3 oxidase
MYSFPKQTSLQIKKDLESLLSLSPEHVSCYSLTIEEQSRFHVKGVQLPDKHKQAKAYEQVRCFLEENGLRQYEISNFAKPGKASAHNLNYWLGGNYFGVGMGAHSHCNGRRSWNVSRLKEYIKRMESNNMPEEGNECLPPEKRFKEALLFGLRMNQGVDIRKLENRFDYCLNKEEHKNIDCFVEDGLLNNVNGVVKVANKGRLVLDEISARLI